MVASGNRPKEPSLFDRAIQPVSCLHCGLPSGTGEAYCCAGCEAIAAALAGRPLPRAAEPAPGVDLAHYDDPAVASRFVRSIDEAAVEALFVVEGLRCGACAWL